MAIGRARALGAVYHGPAGWTGSTRLSDLIDPIVTEVPELGRLTLELEHLLDDLTAASDEDLLGLFAN